MLISEKEKHAGTEPNTLGTFSFNFLSGQPNRISKRNLIRKIQNLIHSLTIPKNKPNQTKTKQRKGARITEHENEIDSFENSNEESVPGFRTSSIYWAAVVNRMVLVPIAWALMKASMAPSGSLSRRHCVYALVPSLSPWI